MTPDIEGAEADVAPVAPVAPVPKVPIHHAPLESPRKKRGRPPKAKPNMEPERPERPAVTGKTPETQPARRGHALDFAPVHSKIVVTNGGAVLATPEHATYLPNGDIAHTLPEGARIFKVADGQYRSEQLSPSIDYPPTVHDTAMAAIHEFVGYFHRRT